jgi:hypothetical protein
MWEWIRRRLELWVLLGCWRFKTEFLGKHQKGGREIARYCSKAGCSTSCTWTDARDRHKPWILGRIRFRRGRIYCYRETGVCFRCRAFNVS